MRLKFDPAAVDGTPEGVKGRRRLGGFGSVGALVGLVTEVPPVRQWRSEGSRRTLQGLPDSLQGKREAGPPCFSFQCLVMAPALVAAHLFHASQVPTGRRERDPLFRRRLRPSRVGAYAWETVSATLSS